MAKGIGFRSNSSNDLYVFMEDDTAKSVAIGTDFSDNSDFKIVLSPVSDSTPSVTPAQFTIGSTVNGNITLTPNGSGDVIVSYLSTGVVQSDNTGALSSSNGTDGQVLIADTGGTPLWQNITAGTGISIANAANSITVNSTGGGMTWNVVTTAGPIQTVANNGYIENYGITQVSLILPLSPSVGTIVEGCCTSAVGALFIGIAGTVTIQGLGLSGQLAIGTSLGSPPAGDRYCCIKLLCVATSGGNVDTWQIVSMTGNWVFQN